MPDVFEDFSMISKSSRSIWAQKIKLAYRVIFDKNSQFEIEDNNSIKKLFEKHENSSGDKLEAFMKEADNYDLAVTNMFIKCLAYSGN